MSRYLVILFSLFYAALFFCAGLSETQARENPFRHDTVCVPLMDGSAIPMEFYVTEASKCLTNERLMKVYRHEKEGIILLPAPPVKTAEDEKEEKTLENFKKFYGK